MLKKTRKTGGVSKRPFLATYAIVHGLAEGPLVSRRLRRALEAAGFLPAKASEADIIVTHSGGIYALPKAAKAKLFLHINPSNVSIASLVSAHAGKIRYDYRLSRQRHQTKQFATNLFANGMYMLNVRHNAHMLKGYMQATERLPLEAPTRHVFLRNHIDNLCNPGVLLQATDTAFSYLTLPGHHDDCWRDPEPYVQLVKALYN